MQLAAVLLASALITATAAVPITPAEIEEAGRHLNLPCYLPHCPKQVPGGRGPHHLGRGIESEFDPRDLPELELYRRSIEDDYDGFLLDAREPLSPAQLAAAAHQAASRVPNRRLSSGLANRLRNTLNNWRHTHPFRLAREVRDEDGFVLRSLEEGNDSVDYEMRSMLDELD